MALEYSQEDALQNNVINPVGVIHIWNEIFEKHWQFTGSSTDNIQNESVSASLLSLIHRITGSSYGLNSKNKLDENMHTPSLSLLQLIHFAQFAKDKIHELHTILLTMRHHLVFMSLCIAFSEITLFACRQVSWIKFVYILWSNISFINATWGHSIYAGNGVIFCNLMV